MHLLLGGELTSAALGASVVKVTVVLGLARMVASVARKRTAALRHLVWSIGIVAALALPLLTPMLPQWHSNALGSVSSAIRATQVGVSGSSTPTLFSFVVDATAAPPLQGKFVEAGLFLWLAGALIVMLRLAIGVARLVWVSAQAQPLLDENWRRVILERTRELGIGREVRVLQCNDAAAMPVTWGIFRPAILLPKTASEWSEERKRIVICHELAHIARRDWGWQMLAELARGVYWFHPLAWLAARRVRQESECSCDDLVLQSGVAATQYAQELLELAQALKKSDRAWSTALALTRPSHFERRFTAMLNPSTNHGCLSAKARMAAMLAALCLLIPFAALRLPAQSASAKFSGIVYDPSGTPVSNATVIMANAKSKTADMTTSDAQGNFHFGALPAGEYEMKVLKPGFAAFVAPQIAIEANRDASQNATLKMGTVTEEVDVVAEGRGSQESKTPRVRLGGEVQAPKVVNKVQPVYPQSAKDTGAQGTVVLHAIIGMNGSPLSLRVINSDINPDLARSAVEAVSKWRYSPTLLNGQPIEVNTTISVNFTMQP